MNINDQTVQIKGDGHPDSVAHFLSKVALNEIESFNDEIYVNVDSSIIKAGKTPELILSGYMCFDFNKYEIDYRYKLETQVSERIYSAFKSLFPYGRINVSFNFALFPDNRKKLVDQGLHDKTATVTTFYPNTELEVLTGQVATYLNDLHYAGKDFKIQMTHEDLIVNQCFFQQNRSLKDRLKADLEATFDIPQNIIINPDQDYTGVLYHTFGSKIFETSTGVASNWNGVEGFYSPQRPTNSTYILGKNTKSSVYELYTRAKAKAREVYKETETPVNVSARSIIGEPKDKIELTIN